MEVMRVGNREERSRCRTWRLSLPPDGVGPAGLRLPNPDWLKFGRLSYVQQRLLGVSFVALFHRECTLRLRVLASCAAYHEKFQL